MKIILLMLIIKNLIKRRKIVKNLANIEYKKFINITGIKNTHRSKIITDNGNKKYNIIVL